MPAVFDQAVCIRHWDWSETSQTVSVLTRERGIVRGIAKGSRREHAPFSGGIELLAVGEVGFILKPARTESALTTLTSWDLREHFIMPRRSLACFNMAMGAADALQKSLREFDPHPMSYEAFLAFLRELEQGADAALALAGFLGRLVDDLGYRIDAERDVQTRQPLVIADDAQTAAWFVPEQGGFTLTKSVGAWGTRGSTISLLRGLARGDANAAWAEDASIRAARLLASYLAVVIESEIPALQSALQSASDARTNPPSAPST